MTLRSFWNRRWVSNFCAGRQLLGHGAGCGHWAEQMSLGGVDVVTYDSSRRTKAESASLSRATGQSDVVWHHVGEFEAK
jgi:hypothetical protein